MTQKGKSKDDGLDVETHTPDGRPLDEQPKWRRDFPIDSSADEYISRRDFAKFVILTSAAFSVGQFWIYLRGLWGRIKPGRPAAAAIARLDELPIGEAKTFRYPSEDGTSRILVRTGERDFVAYDQQCTHLLCPVVPAVEKGQLHCPCHNGWFDLNTGQVVAGPPRRPLARVRVEVRGDQVYATGVEEVA